MPRILLLSFLFCTLVAAAGAAQATSLTSAANAVLEAWDEGSPLPAPKVAGKDRAALRWLCGALQDSSPANPFRAGSSAWREAEAFRQLDRTLPEARVQALKPSLAGSWAMLWRWGRDRVRQGRLDAATRRAWEDRMADAGAPPLFRSLALRHALCFALAEGDEARMVAFREHFEETTDETFRMFQQAFALLGGPAPEVRLWTLPGLEPRTVSLGELGASVVWIAPLEQVPPAGDTAWIIPTEKGDQPPGLDTLTAENQKEAQALLPRLKPQGQKAFLAPSREFFEAYALVFFPVELTLDAEKRVTSIRMGDAALAKR